MFANARHVDMQNERMPHNAPKAGKEKEKDAEA
jgi:hypothetical protein